MSTSTPPAWGWLNERYVPVETPELSTDSRILPATAPLREQNDGGVEPEASCSTTRKLGPDPTGTDIWPLERAVVTTAIGDCCADQRIGTCYLDPDTRECVMPGDFIGEKELRWMPAHECSQMRAEALGGDDANLDDGEPISTVAAERCAPDKLCGVRVESRPEATALADSFHEGSSFHQGENSADVKVETCPVCLHEMENDEEILCDLCDEPTGPGSFAVVNGPGGVFVYHLRCYDEAYWGGHDDGQEADHAEEESPQSLVKTVDKVADQTLDVLDHSLDSVQSFSVPFKTQEFMFEELAPVQAEYLHDILNDHMELIIEMARERFREGYAKYGSAAYQWDAETRLTNVLEELADSVVYCTTGPIE